MKFLTLSLLVLAFAAQAQAKPHTLTCTDLNSKSEKALLTATIVSDTTLRDVKFQQQDEDANSELKDAAFVVTGTMVVSHHSPYQGDIQYNLPNGITLLLPTSLADSDLKDVFAQGIGYQENENGALIGSYNDGDAEGGNHFSVRLNCSSDK